MATLTANLFLDTSGFTSGIDKARSAASNYHQEMSRAAKSISGLEGNIRVLQMQSDGYSDLAASLKQTLAVEAQADKLAKSGLITKEKAIALLNEQRLLETNIATQQKANAAAQAAAAQRTSALTAEVERARAASEQYERQMRKSAEVTSQIQGNIRILEMQAAGYHDLAASMRASMNIEAQAEKLAKDGLMTKKQAIELLTKQHLLEKNVATEKARAAAAEQAASQRAKELAADIERARVAAANYNSEMSRATMALKGVEQNIRILRMQAAGHDELASFMRANIELEARAEKLAKDGLITKEKAIELLREQQTLERNIATQKTNSASAQAAADKKSALLSNPRAAGLPEAPLTDAYLKQTERAAFVAQDARNKFNRLTGAMGNSSMGFLAFSQAVEDAQYGIKGVLNNIPQMILGFGGSMGLAGAISLAAVAAVSLYPVLKRLYSAVENDILKKAADEWSKVFNKGQKAAQEAYNSTIAAKKLKENTEVLVQQYKQLYSLGQDFASIQRRKIEGLESERGVLDEIYELRSKIAVSEGKMTQEQANEAANQRDIKFIQDKIALLKEEQNYINERNSSASSKLSINKSIDEKASSNDARTLQELQTNLSGGKANLKSAEIEIDQMREAGMSGSLLANAERNARIAKDYIATIKEEIEAHKQTAKSNSDARAEIIKDLENEIKVLDEKNNKSFTEQRSLEALIIRKKELNDLSKKSNDIEKQKDLKPQQDAYRLEAEMVRARIAGDEKKIADLERQKAIQEEIVALNKLGMTGDKAKDTAAKMVDARAAAEEADKNRKDKPKQAGSSGPPVAGQLGSVARATNIMMGRAANDGLLEENRRQSALLRSIEKNTKPKPTKTEIPDFVFH
jgi:hypothetical protein